MSKNDSPLGTGSRTELQSDMQYQWLKYTPKSQCFNHSFIGILTHLMVHTSVITLCYSALFCPLLPSLQSVDA